MLEILAFSHVFEYPFRVSEMNKNLLTDACQNSKIPESKDKEKSGKNISFEKKKQQKLLPGGSKQFGSKQSRSQLIQEKPLIRKIKSLLYALTYRVKKMDLTQHIARLQDYTPDFTKMFSLTKYEQPLEENDAPSPTIGHEEVLKQLAQKLVKNSYQGEVPFVLFVARPGESECTNDACPAFLTGRMLAEKQLESVMIDASQVEKPEHNFSVLYNAGFYDLLAGQVNFEHIVRSDFKTSLQYILSGSPLFRNIALKCPSNRMAQIFSALRQVYGVIIVKADEKMASYILEKQPRALSHIILETGSPQMEEKIRQLKPDYCEYMRLGSVVMTEFGTTPTQYENDIIPHQSNG